MSGNDVGIGICHHARAAQMVRRQIARPAVPCGRRVRVFRYQLALSIINVRGDGRVDRLLHAPAVTVVHIGGRPVVQLGQTVLAIVGVEFVGRGARRVRLLLEVAGGVVGEPGVGDSIVDLTNRERKGGEINSPVIVHRRAIAVPVIGVGLMPPARFVRVRQAIQGIIRVALLNDGLRAHVGESDLLAQDISIVITGAQGIVSILQLQLAGIAIRCPQPDLVRWGGAYIVRLGGMCATHLREWSSIPGSERCVADSKEAGA